MADGADLRVVVAIFFFKGVEEKGRDMNPAAIVAERQRMEELAKRPNTKVLQVTHDFVAEPWPADRASAAVHRIVQQCLSSTVEDDFQMRKELLRDGEIKAFQHQHPRMFWTLTDRKVVREPKNVRAIEAMLNVHRMVEVGVVQKGDYSNAVATQAVMHALSEGASAPAPAVVEEEEPPP